MNLARLLQAFSAALDLGSPGASTHHQRVTLLAMEIGRALGLPDDARAHLFYAAIIHDIGVSTARERRSLTSFEAGAPQHAPAGARRLSASRVLAPYADAVGHHHDRWDGTTPGGLAGETIPLASRIIHVADRAATLIRDEGPVLRQTGTIVDALRRHSGTLFDPALVDCLAGLLLKEGLLLDATSDFMSRCIEEQAPRRTTEVGVDDLVGIAQVFAEVIDGKSPYTRRHSQNVARVAGRLSAMLGFSANEVKLMEVAGLLHDLGKLSIDDDILDKRGSLAEDEFLVMKQHPYYTYRILRMVDGLEAVSEWAALHHERMNGTGYPFHVEGDSLPFGARIMAVADVTAALSEDRPYRSALSEDELHRVLGGLASRGELDATITGLLLQHLGEMRSATDKDV
jgi:HD-GYP domain-containing protein (c-di-GMP phosphodiesterase class II)